VTVEGTARILATVRNAMDDEWHFICTPFWHERFDQD